MKTKNNLNLDDRNYIEKLKKTDPVFSFLKNRDSLNFNVGDILIRKHLREGVWQTYNISFSTRRPKKYMVVHKDEYDVCYVKLLKENGELGKQLICLATIYHDFTKFEADPEYVDHVLLNDNKKYNAHAEVKIERDRVKQIKEENEKLNVATSEDDLHEIFKTMKQNTTFWIVPNNSQRPMDDYKYSFDDYYPFKKMVAAIKLNRKTLYSRNNFLICNLIGRKDKVYLKEPKCIVNDTEK